MQIVLIVFSFLMLLYWILDLAGVKLPIFISTFFEGVKEFIHIFYRREVGITGEWIDFSYVLGVLICLGFVLIIKYVVEEVEHLDRITDRVNREVKQKAETVLNAELELESVAESYKVNRVIMMISFLVKNTESDKFFAPNPNIEQDTRDTNIEITNRFYEYMKGLNEAKVQKLGSIVMIYDIGFSGIDEFLSKVESEVSRLRFEYGKRNWTVMLVSGLEAYASGVGIGEQIEKLQRLVKIEFKNKFSCLSTFRGRYLMERGGKYEIVSKGIYKIKGEEEVYILKPRVVNK